MYNVLGRSSSVLLVLPYPVRGCSRVRFFTLRVPALLLVLCFLCGGGLFHGRYI